MIKVIEKTTGRIVDMFWNIVNIEIDFYDEVFILTPEFHIQKTVKLSTKEYELKVNYR